LTVEELRTVQPETELTINRERLRILTYAIGRRARRNTSGRDVLNSGGNNAGYGSMLGGKMRELWRAGLVVLDEDDFYRLTPAGVSRRDEAVTHYASFATGK
jgi:hypothetical protein